MSGKQGASSFDDGKDLFDFMPARPAAPAAERPAGGETDAALEAQVIEALKTVRDPELPVNLVDPARSPARSRRRSAPCLASARSASSWYGRHHGHRTA